MENLPADAAPDLSPARFAYELWKTADPTHWVEFRFLQYRPTPENPDAKHVEVEYHTVEHVLKPENFPDLLVALTGKNRKLFNIHHGVNPRTVQRGRGGGRNQDVTHYVCVWVDIDFHGEEAEVRRRFMENLELLREKGLYPSCILESGYGLHAYWLFETPYPSIEVRPFCAGLQKYLGSDAVSDPARILRFPGTSNVKDPKHPTPCKVIEASWQRFKLEAFQEFRAELTKSRQDLEEEKEKEESRDREARISVTHSRDPEIEHLKKGPIRQGERHNAAVRLIGHWCATLKKLSLVEYAVKAWNENRIILPDGPLPEEEIQTIMNDFWKKEQIKKAEERASKKTLLEEPPNPDGRSDAPWWDDGKFKPQPLSEYLCKKNTFIATPIGEAGIGVNIYVYDDGFFKRSGTSLAETQARTVLGRDAKGAMIDQVLDLVRRMKKIDYMDLNPKALEWINVKNGMFNWKTGELAHHDPSLLSTFQINAEWIPDSKSPELDKFLSDVFPPDALLLTEEIIGYLMIPDTSMQKCFIAIGSGGNGKGTFLKLVQIMLGDQNVSNLSIHKLEQDKFAIASLFGKIANINHDLDSKLLESTGTFKSIVSGDPISAEEKYKDSFSFRPFARILFAANQFPKSLDRTEAFFRRLIFIPFPNRFEESKGRVPDFEKKLAATRGVLQALMHRGVEGLRRLMAAGRFTVPQSSLAAIDEYKRDCSSAYDFITEFCVFDGYGWVKKRTMYQHYNGWCIDEGLKPMSSKAFSKAVEAFQGIRLTHHDGYPGWRGVSWKAGEPKNSASEIREFGGKTENSESTTSLDFL